ncbi:MAG: hypothetical protein CMK44_04255 [Porticoccus sp.]|nr:hypothetical protein [Porticoccus sp.]
MKWSSAGILNNNLTKNMGLLMLRYFISVLFILLSIINLSGCGNKGLLYLPAEPIQVVISNSEEIELNDAPKSSESTKKTDE